MSPLQLLAPANMLYKMFQNHATNSKVNVTDKKVKDTENEPNLHPKKKLPVICIEFQDVNSSRNLINLNKPMNHDITTNY